MPTYGTLVAGPGYTTGAFSVSTPTTAAPTAQLSTGGGSTNPYSVSADGLFDRYDFSTASSILRGMGFGVPSITWFNRQPTLEEITRNITADNVAIPIVYGHAQVGGQIFAVDYNAGTWVVGYLLCLGEINDITNVWINDAAPVAGVTVTEYTGTTTQTTDATLSSAIAGYTDDLVFDLPNSQKQGVAYIVVEYTDDHYDTWPRVVCEIEGKKVWNPKTSTTVYSTNPALHLGDLLSSSIYGHGYTVDDTALEAAQDYCDDTTPGEARRRSYCVIDQPRDTDQWVEVLRGYASCWVALRGDTAHLVPDKTGSSAYTFTADNIIDNSIRIRKQDSSNLPTVMRVSYTDTSGDVWRERFCEPVKLTGVDTGAVPWRESQVRMVGIDRYSQARREAIERLDKLQLSDLWVEWETTDEGLQLEVGDIVTLTHPYGLTNELLRLIADPIQVYPGRWRLVGIEYDAAAYDDTLESAPSYADAVTPYSEKPDAPTAITSSETTYQLRNGEYAARIDLSWTAPANSTSGTNMVKVTGYDVRVLEGTTLVWQGTSIDTEASTPALKEQVTYNIEVRAYNETHISDAGTDTHFLAGTDPSLGSIAAAAAASDGKATVFLQSTTPTAENTNDIWIDTTGGANVLKIWDGDSWDEYQDADISAAYTLADGKNTIYYQTGVPTATKVGDIWVDTTNSEGYRDIKYCTALPSTWATAINGGTIATIETTADGKNTIYYQAGPTEPTGADTNDLWYDSADDNQLYRYDGADWVPLDPDKLLRQSDLLRPTGGTAKTADFQSYVGERYAVDTNTGGEIDMTLPLSPEIGDRVGFYDYAGNFDTDNLIVVRNPTSAEKIFGLTENMTVDVRHASITLEYQGTTQGWVIY